MQLSVSRLQRGRDGVVRPVQLFNDVVTTSQEVLNHLSIVADTSDCTGSGADDCPFATRARLYAAGNDRIVRCYQADEHRLQLIESLQCASVSCLHLMCQPQSWISLYKRTVCGKRRRRAQYLSIVAGTSACSSSAGGSPLAMYPAMTALCGVTKHISNGADRVPDVSIRLRSLLVPILCSSSANPAPHQYLLGDGAMFCGRCSTWPRTAAV